MGVVADTRIALRSLRRSKGYAAATILLLTLGIGANATVFTAVRAALLAPLPFPDADGMILVNLVDTERGGSLQWSWPRLRTLVAQMGPDAPEIGAYGTTSLRYGGPDGTVRIPFEVVLPDYFHILGSPLRLGPGFSGDPEADEVVLSSGFWTRVFGGDPDILGRTVVFERTTLTVVGVGPEGFAGLSGEASGWLPLSRAEAVLGDGWLGPDTHWLQGIGRLQGRRLEEVADRVASAGRAVNAAYPDEDRGQPLGATVERLADARVNPQARRSLLVLSGAALLLFLAAVAHIGGLALARAWQRRDEMDVRRALGARLVALMRLHLVEAGLLALAGWVGACALTVPGSRALARLWPERFLDGAWQVRFVDPSTFRVNGFVLLFGLCLALLSAVVAAWTALVRVHPAGASFLRPGTGAPPRPSRLRDALLVGQTAVTLALLVGFELLLATAGHLQAVPTGINPEGVLSFRVSIPRGSRFLEQPEALSSPLMARIRAMPGVDAVGQGCPPLYGRHCAFGSVEAFDGGGMEDGSLRVGVQVVDVGYLDALGIRPSVGTWSVPAADEVAFLLTRSAARALARNRAAVGSSLRLGPIWGRNAGLEGTVRAVIDDVLYDRPQLGAMPEVFVLSGWEPDGRSYLVRSRSASALVPRIREVLRDLDPQLVLTDASMLSTLADRATADTALALRLLLAFALLGLVVSALGVSAVVAHGVHARRREVAVRMALGAKTNEVVTLLLRRTMAFAGIGILVGACLTFLGARLLQTLLFEVEANDPYLLVGGVAVLATICLGAAWVPASRAVTDAPMEVLRSE